jgi:hypothetical protein
MCIRYGLRLCIRASRYIQLDRWWITGEDAGGLMLVLPWQHATSGQDDSIAYRSPRYADTKDCSRRARLDKFTTAAQRTPRSHRYEPNIECHFRF